MALDIIGWIKGWRLDKFVKKLFNGELDEELKRYGAYSVKLLAHMREVLQSPQAKNVTDFIPGDWDLKLADQLVVIIPKVIEDEIEVLGLLDKPTFGERFAGLAEIISKKDELGRAKAWSGIAIRIAGSLFATFIGGKFDLNKLLILIPSLYLEIFGSKKES